MNQTIKNEMLQYFITQCTNLENKRNIENNDVNNIFDTIFISRAYIHLGPYTYFSGEE